jgi:hypothetical protein
LEGFVEASTVPRVQPDKTGTNRSHDDRVGGFSRADVEIFPGDRVRTGLVFDVEPPGFTPTASKGIARRSQATAPIGPARVCPRKASADW